MSLIFRVLMEDDMSGDRRELESGILRPSALYIQSKKREISIHPRD